MKVLFRSKRVSRSLLPAMAALLAAHCSFADTYTITDIGNLGTDSTGASSSSTHAININGLVIGFSDKYNSSHSFLGTHGVVWNAGTLTDVGALGTDSNGISASDTVAINTSNLIIGNAEVFNASHVDLGQNGFTWQSGTITSIGTLGTAADGSGFSSTVAVNSSGVVAGTAEAFDASHNDLGLHGVVYQSGTLTDIGTLSAVVGGYGFSNTTAINDSGLVIGNSWKIDASSNNLGTHAIKWQAGTLTDLGTLGTTATNTGFSEALALNAGGVIIGHSEAYNASHTDLGLHGVVWAAGSTTPTDIGTLGTNSSGVGQSDTIAINSAGTVIGHSEKYNTSHTDLGLHGIVYSGGTLTDIGTLGTNSSGFGFSDTVAINSSGLVAGTSEKFDASHNDLGIRGVVYGGGILTELATPLTNASGYGFSTADGISDTGIVFGHYTNVDSTNNLTGPNFAFLWSNSAGFETADQFVGGGLAANGWSSINLITGINSGGVASGFGTRTNGSTEGFVLNLQGTGGPSTLLWTGANSTTWDTTTLNWNNQTTNTNPGAYTNGDAVNFTDANNGHYSVTLNATVSPGSVTFSNNNAPYILSGSGAISGSTGLAMIGTSTVTIATNNTYTGGTTINTGGTLQVGNGGATGSLGSGAITNNGALIINLNTTNTFANLISGNGTLALSGPQVITLSGANTYTGDTTINAGTTVNATNNGSLGSTASLLTTAAPGSNVTVNVGGTFDVGGNTTANNANFNAKVFRIAGTGVGGVGALTNSSSLTQYGSFQFITLTANATIGGSRVDIGRTGVPINAGNATVISTLDLANHTLTTNMSGTQPIFGIESNASVTSGFIVVNTGGLDLERNVQFLADANGSNVTFNPNTNLELYQTVSGGVTRPMTFLGNNTIGSGSTTSATFNSPLTLKGNIILEAINSGVASTNANPLTVAGNITESGGSYSVTKTGTSVITLSGANNWSGGTLLQQGTLKLASAGVLPTGTNLTVGSGANAGTLDLNGNPATVGGLTLSGTASTANIITNSSTTPATVTFAGNATPSSFGGLIQNAAGNVSLAVTAGSLTLTAANTYTGGTVLTGGVLSAASDSNLGPINNPLTFNGGTLQVTGVSFPSTAKTINWTANGGAFDINNVANTFTVSTALNGGGLTKLGAGMLVLNQNYTTTAPTIVSAGVLQLNVAANSAAAISGAGTLIVNAGTKASPGLTSDGISVATLAITGATKIRPNGTSTGTSLVNALTLGGNTNAWTATLDITNNKFIVEATTNKAAALATLQNQAAYARSSLFGITSTGLPAGMGVAVLDNAVTNFSTFGGRPVDANSLLLSQELLGDANADGHVDVTDLSTVLNNFGTTTPNWTSGNFDNAPTVDLTDLAAVLNNFGLTNPNNATFTQFQAAAAPEPASLALVAAGTLLLVARNKRR